MRRFTSTLSTIAWSIVLGFGCFVGIGNAANFTDKSIGISIELDDALVEKPEFHGTRFFSTPDNSAAVFIKPVYDLRLYDLRQDLKDGGSWKGDGIKLNVIDSERNASVSYGTGILVPVTGTIREYRVRGVFGGFSGYGNQKFVVLGAARPDYFNEWKERIKAMFESIQFVEIDYSEMMMTWQNRIVGKSLVPENPVNMGQLVSKPINLCSNGTVVDEEPANTQPTVTQQQVWNGYAWVTVPVTQGPKPPARYRIVPLRGKPTLLIHLGPRPLEFTLEMEGDRLYLNGKPFSINENTLCQ